ncbi:hypothetical protein BC827DRAFT_1122948 [Russula dissimulans]|nr:hypothetical protein BC827DRAFT_1122948 [Russula dissimulans]
MSLPATVTSLDYASLESSNPKYVATQSPHSVYGKTHVLGCRWSRLRPPPGFPETSKVRNTTNPSEAQGRLQSSHEALKIKKAWEFATSPLKSLPMQAFMLYMSGGGVQVFSMGIVAMLLLSPFKNLSSMNAAFAPFAPGPSSSPTAKSLSTLPLQKLAYLACNVLTLALGLWKCRSMGLLPTGTGDWLAFESRGPAPEISLF